MSLNRQPLAGFNILENENESEEDRYRRINSEKEERNRLHPMQVFNFVKERNDIQIKEKSYYHEFMKELTNEEKKSESHHDDKTKILKCARNHVGNITKITKNFLEKPFHVYDPQTGKEKGKKSEIKCAYLFPDHSHIVGGMNNGIIFIYSIEENREVLNQELEVPAQKPKIPILSLSITKCGKKLLYGGTKGKVGIYEIKKDQESMSLQKLKDLSFERKSGTENYDIRAVKFSKDDEDVLIGRDDGHLIIYKNVFKQANTEGPQIKKNLHADGLCALAICYHKPILATGGNDKKIKIIDYSQSTLKCLMILTNHTGIVRSLMFSSDGSMLLSGSYDKTAKIFSTSTWEELKSYHEHTEPIFSVAFSPDGKFILTGSQDNKTVLHDRFTGEILATYEDTENDFDIRVVLFVGDGSIIITCGQEGVLNFYSISRGQNVVKHARHGDGKGSTNIRALDVWKNKILTGGEDSTVRIFEIDTGIEIRKFLGHEGCVFSVAFSSNGRRALSAGEDYTVRVYDVITGSLFRCYRDHTERLNVVTYSSTNNEFITGSSDQLINVYDSYKGGKLWTFPIVEYSEPIQNQQNETGNQDFLELSRAPLKKGTVECIATFVGDTGETILISGGSGERNPALNIYKYSSKGAFNLNSLEIEEEAEYGITIIHLTNDNKILTASISIKQNKDVLNQIWLYDVKTLVNLKSPNIPPIAKIFENVTYIEDISQFVLLPSPSKDKLSFISISQMKFQNSNEMCSSIDEWEYNLTTRVTENKNKYKFGDQSAFSYTLKVIKRDAGDDFKIIFGTSNGIPSIIDRKTKMEDPFIDFSSEVKALCISSDGENIAVMNNSHAIRILDAKSGDLRKIIPCNQQNNFKSRIIKFGNNDKCVVSLGEDNVLRFLHYENNPPIYKELIFSDYVDIKTIEYIEKPSSKIPLYFFGTEQEQILFWDAEYEDTVHLLFTYQAFPQFAPEPIFALIPFYQTNKNKQLEYGVYCCFERGRISKFCNILQGEAKSESLLPKHDHLLTCAARSDDYTSLITGADDCCVRVLELSTLEEKVFSGHSSPICAVAFFFETSHAISASSDNVLKVFEVYSGRTIYSIVENYRITQICVSPIYDTVILGTECGLRILERIINIREKLRRFTKTIEHMENFDLNTYELTQDDIGLAPFPLNLSLLNLATIRSNEQIKLLRATSEIVSSFSKEKKQILLDSVFREDEKFKMSPWDWWIANVREHNNKKLYSILVNIVTSPGISGLEKMKNKDWFIKKVAETHPGKLFALLNSFWGELEDMTLPTYESTTLQKAIDIFNKLLRVLNLKNTNVYNGKKDFPVVLLGKTASPAYRYLFRQYRGFVSHGARSLATNYFINTKLSVSRIRLDELLMSKESNTLALHVFENFEPDHSVFRSNLLETAVNYLWHIDCLIGYKFYRDVFIYIIFISIICTNTLYYIPSRENSRAKMAVSDFEYFKKFTNLCDILIIIACIAIILIRVFRIANILTWKKKIPESNAHLTHAESDIPVENERSSLKIVNTWTLLSILMAIIGIIASSFDIHWAKSDKDESDRLDTPVKCLLALFFAVSWFKLIEFAGGIRATSSLVRIFIKVTKDMIPFFLIILFMLLGTSFSTYILQKSYDGPSPWEFFKLIYFVLIGDFGGYNELQTPINKELFFIILFIVTVFMVIFMLNLLIAIISDSNAEVRSTEHQNEIYEKIQIINRRFAEMTTSGKNEVEEAIRDKFIFQLEKIIDEENEECVAERNNARIEKIEKNTDELMIWKEEGSLEKLTTVLLDRFDNIEKRLQILQTNDRGSEGYGNTNDDKKIKHMSSLKE